MIMFTASPYPGEYQGRGNPGVGLKGEETAKKIQLLMKNIYTASPLPGEYQGRGKQGGLPKGEETAMIPQRVIFILLEGKNR